LWQLFVDPAAKWNDIACASGSAEFCPSIHKAPPFLKEIPAAIRGLGLVLDHVSKSHFHDFIQELRHAQRPGHERSIENRER